MSIKAPLTSITNRTRTVLDNANIWLTDHWITPWMKVSPVFLRHFLRKSNHIALVSLEAGIRCKVTGEPLQPSTEQL